MKDFWSVERVSNMSRKRILIIVAAAALLMSAAPSGASQHERRLITDVTNFVKNFYFPTHLPVPSTGSGIGPGSLLLISIGGGQFSCTANFIWTDGTKKYLGTAGHCLLPENKIATHGPGADYNPSGTTVWAASQTAISGAVRRSVGLFG